MCISKKLWDSLTMRTGAMVNQTTTMTSNTVQKSLLTIDGTGMICTVSPIMTGSARYAKVTPTGLIMELHREICPKQLCNVKLELCTAHTTLPSWFLYTQVWLPNPSLSQLYQVSFSCGPSPKTAPISPSFNFLELLYELESFCFTISLSGQASSVGLGMAILVGRSNTKVQLLWLNESL